MIQQLRTHSLRDSIGTGELGRDLVVLLGEDDNNPNHHRLNRKEQAMAQGRHRLERGQKFHAMGKVLAQELRVLFKWRLETVFDAAHSKGKMSDGAAEFVGKEIKGCVGDRPQNK